MNHLETGARAEELDDSAVGQRGKHTEGLTVLVGGRGQEAGGKDHRCAVGQTGEVGGEGGDE